MNEGIMLKGAHIEKSAASDEVMQQINQYTLSELSADDVFTFKVAMCGNQIDRDFEAFSINALKQMGELFVGKTIIKDHRHTADNQVARIYATELVSDGSKSATGEDYTQLVAHCYMLKAGNDALIAEIAGGIKKEVSVGFRCNSAICSICGTDNAKMSCAHWWGKEYEGKTCYFTLDSVTDAYELSFVAVPAQPDAGTVKSYGAEKAKSDDAIIEKHEEPAEDIEKQESENDGRLATIKSRVNDSYLFIKDKE